MSSFGKRNVLVLFGPRDLRRHRRLLLTQHTPSMPGTLGRMPRKPKSGYLENVQGTRRYDDLSACLPIATGPGAVSRFLAACLDTSAANGPGREGRWEP